MSNGTSREALAVLGKDHTNGNQSAGLVIYAFNEMKMAIDVDAAALNLSLSVLGAKSSRKQLYIPVSYRYLLTMAR